MSDNFDDDSVETFPCNGPIPDPAIVGPASIARRLKLIAKNARAGRIPGRAELIAMACEIGADAFMKKRSYETAAGLKTYDDPDRKNGLRAFEMATTMALDPKIKPEELPSEAGPEVAKQRLRELGYELVKVSGPVGSA